MLRISEFFKRIQSKHTQELFVRTVVRDAIQKHCGAVVPIEHISFDPGTVILRNISSAARSAIFIKKQKIVQAINEAQTIKTVSDIR